MIESIGWILSGMTILGAILNSFKNRWGFIVWIIANVGWILFNIVTGTYSQIPVWIAMTVISIFGFARWSKEAHKPLG